MLTEEVLKNSSAFKSLVTGRVSFIHNTYFDNKEVRPAYIVVHGDFNKWTITRFWQSPNRKDQLDKIHTEIDYVDISTTEVFKVLLSEYSCGLK